MSDRRLLAVFAHPDDESCGAGGTVARYASQGVEVTVVSATRGERGGGQTNAALGRLRAAEFECACRALGVSRSLVLDYPDSAVDERLPELEVELAALVHDLRPHVILTFDPGSNLGGPDHRAVGAAATRAFQGCESSGRYDGTARNLSPPLKLYYWLVRPCCGVPTLAPGDIVVALSAAEYSERRRQALLCHRSQPACCERHLARLTEPDEAVERFRLGYHRLKAVASVEVDLFAGVEAT